MGSDPPISNTIRVFLAAVLSLSTTVAPAAIDPGSVAPPQLDFTPNPPGSYKLEKIQRCPSGVLLDANARVQRLADFTRDKVTLLTFFYSYCTDAWGCPFAARLMHDLRERISADSALRDGVRFVSISFDPTHDTPQVLRLHAGAANGFDWRWFTTRSVSELMPILDGFGQDVRVERDARGRPTRTLNHMLKMFLIDRTGFVREIYSLDYMAADVVLNDIATLVMERPQ